MTTVYSGQIIKADENNNLETRVQAVEALARRGYIVNWSTAESGSVSGSITSSSWTAVSSGIAVTKHGSSSQTDLMVTLHAGWRTATAPTLAEWGVTGIGSGYGVTVFEITSGTGPHFANSGQRKITGVAAGSYTLYLAVKRNSGSGAIVYDSNDTFSLTIEEIPK